MSIASEIQRLQGAKGDIVDAINTKSASTVANNKKLDQLADLIDGIESGESATAAAADIRLSKTACVNKAMVTGTMPEKAAATYTPGTSSQTIDAGQYLAGAQTIMGDANLLPGNILSGKSIFGVSGTVSSLDTTDANASAEKILSGYTAYVNGSKVTGNISSIVAKTYTPGTTSQTIAARQYLAGAQTIMGDANLLPGNILSGKSIFGVSGTVPPPDPRDATASASKILSGYTAYVNGSKVTGNIPSKVAATYTPGTSSQTISSGQYLSGMQTILGDSNLIPSNIVSGKSIFGVTGTYSASSLDNYYYFSTSYAADEQVTVVCGFQPKCAYGYAKLTNDNSNCRMFGWCSNAGGIFSKSNGTIEAKVFTASSTSLTFIPNGTRGTYYIWIKG